MKKLLLLICIILFSTNIEAFADDKTEVMKAFNNYIASANAYSNNILNMYSPNAKIIRQVVKPDGTTVNATTNMHTYTTQLKLGQAGAKLRGYKNTYTNVQIAKVSNGYKVSALRQPSGETYKLKIYQIWKEQNGKWVIVEELMQTKEQIFLKYADK